MSPNATVALERRPYNGAKPKLVLAFDVGTTYSGISYTIMYPGEVPEIRSVTRFPGQENAGNSKIPTIIFYDSQGLPRATGEEALQLNMQNEADSEGWYKAEWFKLHLRPRHLTDISDNLLPRLPPNKTVVDVFGDFLRYLRGCARDYIRETYAGGADLWQSLEQDIQFVLSHPNGWRGLQQRQMRRAAVSGGLVPDSSDGHSRLLFVTEGEACLHFCLQSGFVSDSIRSGNGTIIVDAGGGTVDLSAYRMNASQDSFEEVAVSDCLLQGSTYVTRRANTFLRAKLRGSLFGSVEQINEITDIFDKTTKRVFRNREEPQFVKFGARRDKDPDFQIVNGQLKLSGADVAAFFEPSVAATIDSIERQLSRSQCPVSAILLVGGFAASPWLYSRLRAHLETRGVQFCRPDDHVNKAVADGAVSFYLDRLVVARVSSFDYGADCCIPFHANDPEHLARANAARPGLPAPEYLGGSFDVILPKGVRVEETQEFRRDYNYTCCDNLQLSSLSEDILYYTGGSQKPKWISDERVAFKKLCTVTADTSELAKTLSPRAGQWGSLYTLDYSIILQFGLTELKAQVSWTEGGRETRSEATIVYDDEDDDDGCFPAPDDG